MDSNTKNKWLVDSNQKRGQQMTEQTARILNALLGKLVFVLAIASALVLAPIISAGVELLGKA